ncbi:MAG: hypothetical protein J0M34_01745 [Alphaproteobacteria bacterium]|nr:hypothetical protein [Alphaproteobacteria bacterium]
MNQRPMQSEQEQHDSTSVSAQQQAASPSQGNWFHRNRWFTKEPVSYTAYQFFRSAMATIPYGFGMAAIHHLFGWVSAKGQDLGLTEEGNKAFKAAFDTPVNNPLSGAKEGMKGGFAKAITDVVDKTGDAAHDFHKAGWKGKLGRNMIRVANSPLNAALQIGLAFSMFRFVGSLIKGTRDKIMDENNSAADTERETKNWWSTVTDLSNVNWKAEAVGTFWAAITLGFIGANFKQSTPYMRIADATTGAKEGLGQAFGRVWSGPSKLLQNCAIWALSYSAFFEVDERIQKDVKLRQGTWKGPSNSLLNTPNQSTGEPPIKEKESFQKKEDNKATEFFTHDPGLPRLIFRRVLPVAVGISAYAVLKRAGYVMAGGQMKPITHEIANMGAGKQFQTFVTNAWREGAATAMFGALWMSTDSWGTWYDKFFEQFNKKEPTPLNEAQSNNHAKLLARLNEKEKGHGGVAA